MNAVILACTALKAYVLAAQEACGTDYPVVSLDRQLHVDPNRMRGAILSTLDELPEEVDTVLVAMGYCGGSWRDITSTRRIVMPRVDDCVTFVMTLTDEVRVNTKQTGHMYVYDEDSEGFTIGGIYEDLIKKHGERVAQIVFRVMFKDYHDVDIIDTGVYDCRAPHFVKEMQADADRINGKLNYISGSNRLLEKLLSGRWDDQLLVAEPGTKITQEDFL